MAIITPSDISPPAPTPQHPGRESGHAQSSAPASSLPLPVLRYAIYAALAVGLYFAFPYFRTGYETIVGGKKDDVKKGQPAIPVSTATAKSGEMNIYLTGLGTATSLKTVTIRSRVDGELTKVLFKEGDRIEEGKLLAQIDPRPYKIVLEQAESQKLRDEATLANANAIQARNLSLIKSNAVARQDVETQATVIKELEALVKTDQARVNDAALNVEYCDIKAPCAGRIGLRSIDQGNMIRANETQGLAVITQLTPISVIFAIPQDSISKVQKQINAGKTLVVDAYDRGIKTKLDSGTLLAIDNQVDPTTGTVRLKARFDNKDQLLYPNQFVNVRLLLETRRETILVPAAAVQTGPESDFVYVVSKDKEEETVELRLIQQGPREGDLTAIESGLADGEIVVVDGIDKLKPGSKVTTRKPDDVKQSIEGKQAGEDSKSGEGKKPAESQGKQPPAKEAS